MTDFDPKILEYLNKIRFNQPKYVLSSQLYPSHLLEMPSYLKTVLLAQDMVSHLVK